MIITLMHGKDWLSYLVAKKKKRRNNKEVQSICFSAGTQPDVQEASL